MGVYSRERYQMMQEYWCPVAVDLSASATDPVWVMDAAAMLSVDGDIIITDFISLAATEAVGDATTPGVVSLEYGGSEKATISWDNKVIGTVLKASMTNLEVEAGTMIELIHKTQASGGTTTGIVYMGFTYVICAGQDYDQLGT